MNDEELWPEWLNNFRIDDEYLEKAYEETGSLRRSLLKTGIALTFWQQNHFAEKFAGYAESPHHGLWKREKFEPVLYSAVFFTPEYRAAARICAAAVLPAIAGAMPPCAVCVDGLPQYAALCALELSGAEDIFCLNSQTAEKLLESLVQTGKSTACVMLHDGSLQNLAQLARVLHIPVYEEIYPPNILVLDTTEYNPALLEFAHGYMPKTGKPDKDKNYDAIFCNETGEKALELPARLILPPESAGFWQHQGLDFSFFRKCRLSCGLQEEIINGMP